MKLSAAQLAEMKRSSLAALEPILSELEEIGNSVTARDYVERLLDCEGPKRTPNLAKVLPKISEHKLRRVITDKSWRWNFMEEPMLNVARMRNHAAAVVIEPVLIWRRGAKMEGVVEIQPPGWDKPFLAQVVLLASVAGIVRTIPILWRLVRFSKANPTLDEVREACAQKILETAEEIRRMTKYKPKIPLNAYVKDHDDNEEEDYWAADDWDDRTHPRPIVVQGSDLVAFSVVPKLAAAGIPVVMMLPETLSVQLADAQANTWFRKAIPKRGVISQGGFAIGDLAGAFATPPSKVTFPRKQHGAKFVQFPIRAAQRGGATHLVQFNPSCDLVVGSLHINLNLRPSLRPTVRHYSLIPAGMALNFADIEALHHYALSARGMLAFLGIRLGLADYQGMSWDEFQKHLNLVRYAWLLAQARQDYHFGKSRAVQHHIKLGWERKLESPFLAPLQAPMSAEDLKNMQRAVSPSRRHKRLSYLPSLIRPNLRPPTNLTESLVDLKKLKQFIRVFEKMRRRNAIADRKASRLKVQSASPTEDRKHFSK